MIVTQYTYGKESLPTPKLKIPEFPIDVGFEKIYIDYDCVNNVDINDGIYKFNLISTPMIFNSNTGTLELASGII